MIQGLKRGVLPAGYDNQIRVGSKVHLSLYAADPSHIVFFKKPREYVRSVGLHLSQLSILSS